MTPTDQGTDQEECEKKDRTHSDAPAQSTVKCIENVAACKEIPNLVPGSGDLQAEYETVQHLCALMPTAMTYAAYASSSLKAEGSILATMLKCIQDFSDDVQSGTTPSAAATTAITSANGYARKDYFGVGIAYQQETSASEQSASEQPHRQVKNSKRIQSQMQALAMNSGVPSNVNDFAIIYMDMLEYEKEVGDASYVCEAERIASLVNNDDKCEAEEAELSTPVTALPDYCAYAYTYYVNDNHFACVFIAKDPGAKYQLYAYDGAQSSGCIQHLANKDMIAAFVRRYKTIAVGGTCLAARCMLRHMLHATPSEMMSVLLKWYGNVCGPQTAYVTQLLATNARLVSPVARGSFNSAIGDAHFQRMAELIGSLPKVGPKICQSQQPLSHATHFETYVDLLIETIQGYQERGAYISLETVISKTLLLASARMVLGDIKDEVTHCRFVNMHRLPTGSKFCDAHLECIEHLLTIVICSVQSGHIQGAKFILAAENVVRNKLACVSNLSSGQLQLLAAVINACGVPANFKTRVSPSDTESVQLDWSEYQKCFGAQAGGNWMPQAAGSVSHYTVMTKMLHMTASIVEAHASQISGAQQEQPEKVSSDVRSNSHPAQNSDSPAPGVKSDSQVSNVNSTLSKIADMTNEDASVTPAQTNPKKRTRSPVTQESRTEAESDLMHSLKQCFLRTLMFLGTKQISMLEKMTEAELCEATNKIVEEYVGCDDYSKAEAKKQAEAYDQDKALDQKDVVAVRHLQVQAWTDAIDALIEKKEESLHIIYNENGKPGLVCLKMLPGMISSCLSHTGKFKDCKVPLCLGLPAAPTMKAAQNAVKSAKYKGLPKQAVEGTVYPTMYRVGMIQMPILGMLCRDTYKTDKDALAAQKSEPGRLLQNRNHMMWDSEAKAVMPSPIVLGGVLQHHDSSASFALLTYQYKLDTAACADRNALLVAVHSGYPEAYRNGLRDGVIVSPGMELSFTKTTKDDITFEQLSSQIYHLQELVLSGFLTAFKWGVPSTWGANSQMKRKDKDQYDKVMHLAHLTKGTQSMAKHSHRVFIAVTNNTHVEAKRTHLYPAWLVGQEEDTGRDDEDDEEEEVEDSKKSKSSSQLSDKDSKKEKTPNEPMIVMTCPNMVSGCTYTRVLPADTLKWRLERPIQIHLRTCKHKPTVPGLPAAQVAYEKRQEQMKRKKRSMDERENEEDEKRQEQIRTRKRENEESENEDIDVEGGYSGDDGNDQRKSLAAKDHLVEEMKKLVAAQQSAQTEALNKLKQELKAESDKEMKLKEEKMKQEIREESERKLKEKEQEHATELARERECSRKESARLQQGKTPPPQNFESLFCETPTEKQPRERQPPGFGQQGAARPFAEQHCGIGFAEQQQGSPLAEQRQQQQASLLAEQQRQRQPFEEQPPARGHTHEDADQQIARQV